MDLKGIMQSEMREKNKCCMISLTWGMKKKRQEKLIEKDIRFMLIEGAEECLKKEKKKNYKAIFHYRKKKSTEVFWQGIPFKAL